MKPIEAKDQARLGWGRCARLALSGMSYRMLRSGITTAILALAVAFLVYTVAHGILAERTRAAAWDELRPTRDAVRKLSRLTTPDTLEAIRRQLAQGDAGTLEELRGWYGGDEDTWQQARRGAEAFVQTQQWFDELSPSASAVLLGGRDLPQRLDEFSATPENTAYLEFLKQADELGLGPSWTRHASEAGDVTIARWVVLQAVARDLQAGHARSIEALAASGAGAWIERHATDEAQSARELRDAGFVMNRLARRELYVYFAYTRWVSGVQTTLQAPEVQRQVRQRWGSDTLAATMRALQDSDSDSARWWRAEVDPSLHPRQFSGLAMRYLREARLAEVANGFESPADANLLGLTPGTLWLVGLSLLVCVVGVTNALLMSVTERFNEIATMKCLGAMDASVMRVFVIEALVQGAVGGAAGVVIGVALALLRGLIEFGGTLALAADSAGQVLLASAVSLGVGVLLATLAAVGPSWIASRLSPMEAMRVE